MMPDPNEYSAPSDLELDELVGMIGNRYGRERLSPPSQVCGAVRHWLGLSHREILDILDRHFDEHRRRYTSGSGDGLFWMVEADIRRAWQAKHLPAIEQMTSPSGRGPSRRYGTLWPRTRASARERLENSPAPISSTWKRRWPPAKSWNRAPAMGSKL